MLIDIGRVAVFIVTVTRRRACGYVGSAPPGTPAGEGLTRLHAFCARCFGIGPALSKPLWTPVGNPTA
ncbi:MAG: hypothetical protein NUV48_15290 [Peptococcaceae bacterium]|nr:hypothetical protein [Peptococcaceae bacterium]